MRNTGLGGESQGQGERCQRLECFAEFGGKNLVGNVEDLGIKEGSVVVDGLEDETVREGFNVELLQEGCLGGSDLFSLGDQVGVVDHLNLTTGNLGSNLQGLEKGSLTGIASGSSLGNDHIAGGDGTDLGGGGTSVGLQNFADFTEVSVGEDKSDIATAAFNELLYRRSGVVFDVLLHTLAHHGVLSHENLGLATEGLTGVLELFGTDIVNFDDKELGIRSQQRGETFEIPSLSISTQRHLGWLVVLTVSVIK
mmetsp:Transcript_17128/g.30806  ORF Transcript_17128/g.30806 Transcript_17128/m.30806 type:complete len:253 (+) Transcript_17128:1880-2638(+)